MKAVGLGYTPVPSPAVLRFLRIQADSLSFLASQKRTCWTQTRRCYDASTRGIASCQEGAANTGTSQLAGAVHAQSSRMKNRRQYSSFASSSPRNISSSISCSRQGLPYHTTNIAARRWFRPWQRIRQKPAGPLQPNDLPPPSILDDNASLGRIVKPMNELQLRCTKFDGNGNVTLINGAFKKSELIAKVRL